jgi:glutathione synthase
MNAPTLAVVMDPIGSIKPYKDTTLLLMLAAQQRSWRLLYLELGDLWIRDGQAFGRSRPIEVRDDNSCWFRWAGDPQVVGLGDLTAILMRKDPPFDLEFVCATYVLERAAAQGAVVVNRPDSLRDCNEKAFVAEFPDCAPPTLIARDAALLRAFHAEQRDVIFKPLDGMGGAGVFRVADDGMNLGVVIETLTERGRRYAMAQRYLPAVAAGDKRILVIDGEPVPYALARFPAPGETRANLAAGGTGRVQPLTDHDRWIVAQLGEQLRRRGLLFVGLDVIGDYLTEINVTSPTCAREIEAAIGLDIGGQFMDSLERALGGHGSTRSNLSNPGAVVKPPSTAMSCPVMKAESSQPRNSTSAATSSGVPNRPSGVSRR